MTCNTGEMQFSMIGNNIIIIIIIMDGSAAELLSSQQDLWIDVLHSYFLSSQTYG